MSPESSGHDPLLVEVAIGHVGVIWAGKALTFAAQWCVAGRSAGRRLSVLEVGEVLGISRAQAYRRWDLVKRALPDVELDRICGALGSALAVAEKRDAVALGARVALLRLSEVGG